MRQLIVYRLPAAETTHHRASTNTQHTSLTTLERRYDPFVIQPPPARHDRGTVLTSPNQSTTAPCISRSSSTFQAIDDSTLSRSRGPSSIHVPSNRRQQTILVFSAIDESTKSSPSNRREHKDFSKQSTTAQSLRLPSNRRQHKVYVFQAIDERSSINTLNDEQPQREKDNSYWPRAQLIMTTHSPTTPTVAQPVHTRALTHARATHSPYKHKLQENCMPVSRTNSLSLLNGNKKKKKKKRKRKKKHTLTIKTQTSQDEKTYECHV